MIRCGIGTWNEAAGAASFSGNDGIEGGKVTLLIPADNAVLVGFPVSHLLMGIFQPEVQLFLGFGAAKIESLDQFLVIGRNDENVDKGLLDHGVGLISDQGSSLNIDVHEDVAPGVDMGDYLRFQRSVVVAVYFGEFEEFTVGGP